MLLDPSLAADASAALVLPGETGLAPWDGHTLSTLVPDLLHTTVYATLGLMGAYVTQVHILSRAHTFYCMRSSCLCLTPPRPP